MREFKFRAWENGKMYYQVRCGGVFDGMPTAPTVWNDEEGDWLNLTGGPYTIVMQYTGLKDCEGNEIYEGDKLCDDNYTNIIGTVYFEDGKFKCIEDVSLFDDMEHFELKISGNVYENKVGE